jgi:peptide/nickel transport system permease protein
MVTSNINRNLGRLQQVLLVGGQRLWAILTSEISAYIFKRILQAMITLLLASILCFVIIQLAPGDYVDTIRGNPTLSPERQAEYVRQFRLDQSPQEQYLGWLFGILGIEFKPGWWGLGYPTWSLQQMGNFGTSFVYGRSVASLLWERIPNTLLLSIASLIVTWGIAIPLGIVAAVNQNRWLDKVLQVVSYTGQGFPSFITALLFLIFAQATPFFPVGNMTSLDFADFTPLGKLLDIGWHMILPTLALSVTSFAGLQRITRGNLLDVLRQNYIQTARAKGLPENRVIYLHALRNAVNPLITLLGFEFAGLLSGAFIAEYFFNWPGLGRLILQALLVQDLYLVMGSLMLGAVMLIVGNLLADILLKLVDPRIKLDAQ